MASKPQQKSTAPQRHLSTGFDLSAIKGDVANLASLYDTVQFKNGSQSALLVRSSGAAAGNAGPVTPTQINGNGVVSLLSSNAAINTAQRLQSLKPPGWWAKLPTAGKAGIIAGGAGLVLVGVLVFVLK